jgi:hypothetical protein
MVHIDRKVNIYLFIGLFLVSLGFLPFLILGNDIPVLYHDQLDGEIFTYIFQAKYLFQNVDIIPELMGGVSKTSLTPPALLTVFLFKIGSPIFAFLLNYYLVKIIAFIGMFLLLDNLVTNKEETKKDFIPNILCLGVSLLFSFLPHITLYGLSITGIPLLVYCIIIIYQKKLRLPYLGIAVYGVSSSLVLVGYAILGCLLLGIILQLLLKNKSLKNVFIRVFIVLLFIYLATNLSLLKQIFLGNSGILTHKEELVLNGMNFWTGFQSVFMQDTLHAASFQKYLILPAIVISFLGFLRYQKVDKHLRNCYGVLWFLLTSTIVIALVYALLHWHPIAQIRNEIGGFVKYVQFDRFYWFYPVLWYLILYSILNILYLESKSKSKAVSGLLFSIGTLLCLLMSFVVFQKSDFKKSIYELLQVPSSSSITWSEYYGLDIFPEIVEYIGKTQESYRVASIGLEPSVSLFHGFYTIDGYSNNYSLDYKKSFRNIIGNELGKNEQLRLLFDQWGNRCYLYTAELGEALVVRKDNLRNISLPDYNYELMKELNCEYIISAAEIDVTTDAPIELLSTFDHKDSFYKIWLYKMK